ncbi:hypothetical protein NYE70_02435 [Paenibacillus sp. FSL R5-0407]|uniref:hypothetical protein n=1 Tax=Paenibacillus sp. FSL R5-0407 TaxID=2975320 RepID=UPI0030FC7607
MESMEHLKERYKSLEERLRLFILVHSDIEYVHGSSECVEGGAFAWSELSAESKYIQSELYHEYISLIKQSRQHLIRIGSGYLETYDRSCAEVKTYVKQENLVWGPSLQDVFNTVKKELDLQRGLIAQPILI